VLVLPEGRAGAAWEPNKLMQFGLGSLSHHNSPFFSFFSLLGEQLVPVVKIIINKSIRLTKIQKFAG
jgi:hypothetical protein